VRPGRGGKRTRRQHSSSFALLLRLTLGCFVSLICVRAALTVEAHGSEGQSPSGWRYAYWTQSMTTTLLVACVPRVIVHEGTRRASTCQWGDQAMPLVTRGARTHWLWRASRKQISVLTRQSPALIQLPFDGP